MNFQRRIQYVRSWLKRLSRLHPHVKLHSFTGRYFNYKFIYCNIILTREKYFFQKKIFILTNYLVSVNFSNIRFLGPHFCCRGSPLGPHFTQNKVPMKNILGPHSTWEQWDYPPRLLCSMSKWIFCCDCKIILAKDICKSWYLPTLQLLILIAGKGKLQLGESEVRKKLIWPQF